MKLATRPATIDQQRSLFLHSIDLPNGESVEGRWDLRGDVDRLLGGFDYSGKAALDVYCGTGFFTWEMEKRGATVTSFDMAEPKDRDIIPDARSDHAENELKKTAYLKQRHNGYWLCHSASDSKASVMHGNVYELPVELGPVDVSVLGLTLNGLRDPFFALHNAARLTRERIVVVERLHASWKGRTDLAPTAMLLPKSADQSRSGRWWALPPPLIAQMVGVLGFQETTVTEHQHAFRGRAVDTYTLVAERTEDFNPLMDY